MALRSLVLTRTLRVRIPFNRLFPELMINDNNILFFFFFSTKTCLFVQTWCIMNSYIHIYIYLSYIINNFTICVAQTNKNKFLEIYLSISLRKNSAVKIFTIHCVLVKDVCHAWRKCSVMEPEINKSYSTLTRAFDMHIHNGGWLADVTSLFEKWWKVARLPIRGNQEYRQTGICGILYAK